MTRRLVTIVLAVAIVFCVGALVPKLLSLQVPGNQRGYEPIQPIAFSHRLHAGELQISCVYCHSGVDKSRYAGIPASSVCMNCHRSVRAPLAMMRAEEELAKLEKRPVRAVEPSAELQKLFDSLGLDNKLQPDPSKTPKAIAWVRVHKLPDHACFDHRAHVNAGVDCKRCHGPVETMERVRQVQDLSMGWCVNCHREVNRTGVSGKKVNASIDCSACHY